MGVRKWRGQADDSLHKLGLGGRKEMWQSLLGARRRLKALKFMERERGDARKDEHDGWAQMLSVQV